MCPIRGLLGLALRPGSCTDRDREWYTSARAIAHLAWGPAPSSSLGVSALELQVRELHGLFRPRIPARVGVPHLGRTYTTYVDQTSSKMLNDRN
jgi:hypothetical protein